MLNPPSGGLSRIDDGHPPASASAVDRLEDGRTREARRPDLARASLVFVAALAACLVAYLAIAVPGPWFPAATEKSWPASDLTLVRGTGSKSDQGLLVTAPDAGEITLVNVLTDFRSLDYRAIAWQAAGLAADADARLLWRTDVQPNKLNSAPIRIEGGRALPTLVAGNPAWIGRITGLALAIHGPLPQPLAVGGVVAKPMGAVEVLRDRAREWFVFEPWNGASINTVAGGADYQPLPLPALLAAAVVLAALVVVAVARWRPNAFRTTVPVIVAVLFLGAWALLDARWTWNLARQERDTASRFAGKDSHDKHLANDDADLYAFAQRALAVMPKAPARIFIASDADYFRGRAAYHLYPHRVYFDPVSNRLPAARDLHPGDWLLVYRQRGIQYDRALGKVRWDGGQIVDAELKLVEPGAALFVIR